MRLHWITAVTLSLLTVAPTVQGLTNLTINNATDTNVTGSPNFTIPAAGTAAVLTWASIQTALGNNNTSATTVGSPTNGTDTGAITVTGSVLALSGVGRSLTLTAASGIALNSAITGSLGSTGLVLNANGGTIGFNSTINLTGALAATSSGAITQTGALTISGTSSFAAGSNPITLSNVGNDFTGAVTVTNSGANNVALTDKNGLVIGGMTLGTGTLGINAVNLTQTGAITQAASAGAVTITGNAGPVALTNAGNSFTGAVSVTNSGNNNVALTNNNSLTLGTLTLGTGTLGLNALGLTQTGAIVQAAAAGAVTITGNAAAVTLTNALNDFTGAVTVTNSGNNNVALTDKNGLVIGGMTLGTGTLNLTAVNLTQTGPISQAASAGAVTINGGNGPVTLTNATNNFTGAVTVNNTGVNNVSMTNNSILNLGGVTVGTGTLSLNGVGISQSGAITQGPTAGAVTLTGNAGAVSLSNAGNDFTGAVTVTNSGANNATLVDANSIIMAGATVGGALDVTAPSGISLAGTFTTGTTQNFHNAITLTNTTSLNGTALTLGGTLTAANNNLTLNFSTPFTLPGSISGVKNLTASNAVNVNGTVTTSATQTYNNTLTLTGTSTLAGSTITTQAAIIGGGFGLTVTGNASFGGTMSGLGSLAVSGTTTVSASIATTGTQNYTGAVTLGGTATLTGTSLTLGAGLAASANDLTLGFSTPFTLPGTISGVRNFTASSPINVSGTFTTTGTQTYQNSLTLTGASTLAGTTVTTQTSVIGGGFGLTITGNASLGGTLSGLSSLAVSGTTTLNSGITTTGTQNYSGVVTLGGTSSLAGTSLTLGSGILGATNDLTLNLSTPFTLPSNITGVKNFTAASAINAGGNFTTTGTQTYQNNLTLTANSKLTASTVTLAGLTSGAFGLNVTGNAVINGTTTGLGSLTVTGTTTVNGGGVSTTGLQSYTGAVALGTAATQFDSAGGTITFPVAATITGTNANLTFAGSGNTGVAAAIKTGTGSVTMAGSGNLTLTGANNYTGGTTISSGALLANQTIVANNTSATGFGPVTVAAGGTLGGGNALGTTGSTLGTVTVQSGGFITPGMSSLATGILTINGDVAFATGSALKINILGSVAGQQYGQLAVNGAVNLNNASLTFIGSTFVPSGAQPYTIINNDGTDAVNGTFNNLPEGSPVTVRGVTKLITYAGGSGNDVVLLPNNDATLSNIALSGTMVSPVFDSATLSYTATVPNGTTSITVTPTLTDPYGAITVNGVAVASGTASSAIALNIGPNTITVQGTAQNGTSTKTYTVIVTRSLLPAVFNAATDVPITASTYTPTGNQVALSLNFTPVPGTTLMVINNTGLGFINGTFDNLAQGQIVSLVYGGITYHFVANYFGGTGNDLVLQWAAVRPVGWGLNANGQIGDNSATARHVAVPVTATGALAGKTILALSTGYSHSVALCSDGTLAAWGANASGQLGTNNTTPQLMPATVNAVTGVSALFGKTVVAVAAGYGHSLALCSDGSVAAWGANDDGELGDNTITQRNVPVLVNTANGVSALFGKTVVAIAAGNGHSMALCSDGTLTVWGRNDYGQLGEGTNGSHPVPVTVSTAKNVSALFGKNVIAISAGAYHSLALCSDGSVAAWGSNADGELGDNTTSNRNVPVAVNTTAGTSAIAGRTVSSIAAGSFHTLALCSDGTLVSWGYNIDGRLGDTTTTDHHAPELVNAVTGVSAISGRTVVSISAGGLQSVALCADGTLAAWGGNHDGEVGDNTVIERHAPVAVTTSFLSTGERVAFLDRGSLASHNLALVAMPPTPQITVQQVAGVNLVNGTGLVDFGLVTQGKNAVRTFTVKSASKAILTGIFATVDGTDSSDFTVTKVPATSLAPGASTTFTITFAPSMAQVRTAVLHVSDVPLSSFDIQLKGTGMTVPALTLQPLPLLVAVGQPATFSTMATGFPAPTYQWLKNNVAVSGATGGTYTIGAVSLLQGGTYTVKALNPAGTTLPSSAAELGVVDTTSKNVVLKAGLTASTAFTINTAGNGLTYLWGKLAMATFTPLSATDVHYTGVTGKVLTIKGLATTDTATYACQVTGPGGVLTGGSNNLTVVDTAPEVLQPAMIPPAIVSGNYVLPVNINPASNRTPVSYAATGVPAGMVFSTATGQLTGKPTTAGTFTIKITATNPVGISAAQSVIITVAPLPGPVVGTFNGLADRDLTLSAPVISVAQPKLLGLGGSLYNLVVGSTGTFTGTLNIEDKAYAIPVGSRLDAVPVAMGSPVVNPSATVKLLRGTATDAIANLTFTFSIDQVTGQLTGTVTDGLMSSTPIPVKAWRNPWKTTSAVGSPANPATAIAGTYTAIMDLDPMLRGYASHPGIPQGRGYLTLNISTAGIATWGGKLADGTAVTGSTTVGAGGDVPLHLMLYSPTAALTAGSVHGWMLAKADDPMTPVNNHHPVLDGTVDWKKLPQATTSTTRSYKAGFPLHTLTVTGGAYAAPATNTPVIGITDLGSGNDAKLTFTDGDLISSAYVSGGSPAGSAAGTLNQSLRITTTNAVIMPTGTTNLCAVTLTLSATTGAIGGSFTLKDNNPLPPYTLLTRTVPWSGVIVPRLGKGIGQFLMPQLPSAGPPLTSPTTSPILSGPVTLVPGA